MSVKSLIPILLPILYTLGLLLAGQYSKRIALTINQNSYINIQFNYQLCLLGITILSIVSTYLMNPQNFHTYFSMGQISSPANELSWFGIKQGDSWLKTGLSLVFFISLATGLFMYFQLKKIHVDWSVLSLGIGWILLFSFTNSFGEEMIYRLGIISPLKGLFQPATICFISAVLFGIPHLAGMPNGIIGATMAGLLGYILAKSMIETQGFFWAWIIHFLQDVLIIGSLYLMSYKPTIN